jgi:hypothetical protein
LHDSDSFVQQMRIFIQKQMGEKGDSVW